MAERVAEAWDKQDSASDAEDIWPPTPDSWENGGWGCGLLGRARPMRSNSVALDAFSLVHACVFLLMHSLRLFVFRCV